MHRVKCPCLSHLGFFAFAALTLLLLVDAQAQSSPRSSPAQGRILFHSPSISTNGLSCAHCHADFDERRNDDGRIRAAHSLANSANRLTWWGQELEDPDRYQDIAHAGIVCVVTFMLNPKKLTAQELVDLQAYLKSINRRPELAALTIAPGADPTGDYAGFEGGDKIVGRGLFFAACHACHPNGNDGIAPVGIPRDKAPSFYARKIREGNGMGAKYAGINPDAYDPAAGEYMPFFGLDKLANQEIRDIIAYIKSLPVATP